MSNADYLKRYLSKGETTKKKKKVRPQKSNIIDDDIDLNQIAVASQENNSEDDDDNPVKILEYLENEKANTLAFTTNNWINCDESADIKIEAPDPNQEPLPGFSFGKVTVKEEPLSPRLSETDNNYLTGQKLNQKSVRERHDSSDGDASPPRKTPRYDSDQSPPRRSNHNSFNESPPGRSRQYDSDESPPRRSKRYDSDSSPPRKSAIYKDDGNRKLKSGRDRTPDISPPRRTDETSRSKIKSEPISPRHKRHLRAYNGDNSPPRKPSRKSSLSPKRRLGNDSCSSVKEVMQNSKPEEKIIVRDKTGRKINLDEIRRKKEEEEAVKKAIDSKYKEWSRGLKQKEMMTQMADDFEKESNKPLARYADDTDLNEELRNAENKEDPMFEYMRKKRAKEAGKSGKAKRTYQGPEPPPNRFNIRPGYRWDGVDRSNGFENKLFATKNDRKAKTDDFYKWSTEDM